MMMKYSELAEKKQHGTPAFPVGYYHIDEAHPRYVMPLHWHKEYEIIKVRRGAFTVYLNGKRYDLRSGDTLFVEGGCLKRGYPESCEYECLVFDINMLGSASPYSDKLLGALTAPDTRYKNFIPAGSVKINSAVDELINAVRNRGEFFEIKAVGLLYMLIYELYLSGCIYKSPESSADKGIGAVMKSIRWIDEHITERITLADLSAAVGFCEKYICRIFKEYTSKTVVDYVNEQRIERAAAQMMRGSITEAAFNSGFNDLSYFCKTFKKYKGITPSEYKRIGEYPTPIKSRKE